MPVSGWAKREVIGNKKRLHESSLMKLTCDVFLFVHHARVREILDVAASEDEVARVRARNLNGV